MLSRRAFVTGLIAAPAIVRFTSIMPVKAIIPIKTPLELLQEEIAANGHFGDWHWVQAERWHAAVNPLVMEVVRGKYERG